MASDENLLDRAVLAFVARISGGAAAAVAVAIWGTGIAVPLALHWRVWFVVEANAVGTVFAGVVIIGWLFVRLEQAQRRNLLEWTSDLRLLNAEEFEWLVGEIFRREGWKIRETGRQDAADGNVDLDMTRSGKRMIVQCKRWESWQVGVGEIRQFAGTLMREGLPGSSGLYVTLSDFTSDARAEAKSVGVGLIGKGDLYARIEKVRRSEPCPVCGKPMIVDRSSRGWWMRCVANGCAGKQDLSAEPGRAIELLTRSS
jgi:restriction system protein